MQSIYNYTLEELKAYLQKEGVQAYTAQQVFGWLYKKRATGFSAMTNLSKEMRSYLEQHFSISLPVQEQVYLSADGTIKFLFKLEDSTLIESVLISDDKRSTLCVSTQVGCARGCVFCASSKKGLVRDLTPSEIIGQYLSVDEYLHKTSREKNRITNIVFMGMGEPLENMGSVVKAIRLLTSSSGVGMGKHRICVSTCGLAPQIKAFADERTGVKLSVSLNAITDEKRDQIMPINRKYPLKALLEACSYYARVSRFPVTFEYIMFGGFNILKEDADLLAKKIAPINAKINFIPYNPIGEQLCRLQEPGQAEVAGFLSRMKEKRVFFSVRKSKGRDILAACGNLRYSRLSTD